MNIFLKRNFSEVVHEIYLREMPPPTHIQRNSLSVDDNIYAPPWGLRTLVKEFLAAASIMQSSSNELSNLVSSRVENVNKRTLLLLLLYNTLIPASSVLRV